MIKRFLNFLNSNKTTPENSIDSLDKALSQLKDIEIKIEEDIVNKVKADFKEESANALKLLQNCENKNDFGPRVIRCIVHLSKGDIKKLFLTIERAEIDWRDIIDEAEEETFQFNNPFS